ncbi:Uncharacterised protein [Mycobacterium tuberculosis]|nr:Uncharacterised protein [Mycobacterium tuberculosis]
MFEVGTLPAFSTRVNTERSAIVPRRQRRAQNMKWRRSLLGVIESRIVIREAPATNDFDNRRRARLTDHRNIYPFGNMAVAPQFSDGGFRVTSAQCDSPKMDAVLRKSQLARLWGVPVVGLVEPNPEHQRLRQLFGNQRLGELSCGPN